MFFVIIYKPNQNLFFKIIIGERWNWTKSLSRTKISKGKHRECIPKWEKRFHKPAVVCLQHFAIENFQITNTLTFAQSPKRKSTCRSAPTSSISREETWPTPKTKKYRWMKKEAKSPNLRTRAQFPKTKQKSTRLKELWGRGRLALSTMEPVSWQDRRSQ